MMSGLNLLICNILIVLSLIFVSCNDKKADSTEDLEPEKIVEINIHNPTRLMTGARCGPPAGAKLTGDIRFNNENPSGAEWTEDWRKTDDKMVWMVNVAEQGRYKVVLIYRCSKGSAGSKYEIICGESKIEGEVRESVSPYFENSWEEIKVNGILKLAEGINEITIQATHIPENANVVMDLFSLVLTPISAYKQIQQDSVRAVSTRTTTDWFVESKYGLMVHWIPESTPPEGPSKPYAEAVNEFNAENFAKMVSETGAGYIIFHIAGHNMPAPIKAWEEVHGNGSTTKRDLIEDLINALDKYDIRFILGQGLPEIGRFWEAGYELHVNRFKKIFTEIGQRYGDKLAGTYFDGGREMTAFDVDWEGMFQACKTGNPNRLLSYNFWVFPLSTEWLDFWTGEGGFPYIKFEGRYIKAGAGKGLQAHVMFPVDDEHRWWFKDENHVIGPPVYSTEQMIEWVRDSEKKGVVPTFNMAIYQDGTVSSETLEQMKAVRRAIRAEDDKPIEN